MSFGESLTKIRKSKGISRKDFAEQLQIPYTTLRNYETDQREPGHKLLIRMATLLSVSVDDLVGYQLETKTAPSLSSEALKLADDFDHHMDTWGQKAVRGVADIEIARCKEARAAALQKERTPMETGEALEAETVCFMVPWFFQPMGAGPGEEAGSDPPEDLRLTKAPPRGTSFVARVHGLSMEPTYHNGDLVFVHSAEEIPVGSIGAFFMDGQQWIKELGDGELISHNPDPQYAPRPFTEDIKCQGLVLGVCDKSYFE